MLAQGVSPGKVPLDRRVPKGRHRRLARGLTPRDFRGVLVSFVRGVGAFPMVQSSVAPLPLLIFRNAFQQMQPAKIRPQRWSHINLGIRQLPEQKIAQTHFA